MSVNPYQSPIEDGSIGVGVRSGKMRDVRSVAIYQKGIQLCILLYVVAVIAWLLADAGRFPLPAALRILPMTVVLGVAMAGLAFVVLLAMKVYNVVVGILLGVLMLVPLIGLLVLLHVNSKATQILRDNALRVGLLGASLAEVDRRLRQTQP